MKTQVTGYLNQSLSEPSATKTATCRRRLLRVALALSALLLVGSIAGLAQSPPSTYTAEAPFSGAAGTPTSADGNSGLWNFDVSGLSSYAYNFRDDYYPTGADIWHWSFDYSQAGTFTLGDGTDAFSGHVTSGYGYATFNNYGPPIGNMTLDIYFTGEWNDGLKQSGLMVLTESWEEGPPSGSRYGELRTCARTGQHPAVRFRDAGPGGRIAPEIDRIVHPHG